MHESQLFPVRQHFDYGSPPRGTTLGSGSSSGVVVGGGAGVSGDIDDKSSVNPYVQMDDKFDNHCSDG